MSLQDQNIPIARSRDHPLVQWMRCLTASQYKCTQQEKSVWEKCHKRFVNYRIEGGLVTGFLVWSVAHGLKWKLWKKLAITTASASMSAVMASVIGVKPCMEDILSLDGSRFQQELVAILQREQVHNPRLREILKKYYYLEVVYDDSNQSMPGVRLRKLFTSGEGPFLEDDTIATEHMLPESQDLQIIENQLRKPREVASSEECEYLDPFNMFLWGVCEDEPSTQANEKQQFNRRKRWANDNERREYNRMRYLQWKQKTQQLKQEQ